MIDWSKDFLEENTARLSGPDPLHTIQAEEGEALWAEQYLTDLPTLLHPVTPHHRGNTQHSTSTLNYEPQHSTSTHNT